MCARPFGGFDRLDRIDFTAFASGTDSPYKLLYLKVISQAATDYLYFGLGHNGTLATQFWYASEYFFTVRSYIADSWGAERVMRKDHVDDNDRRRVSSSLILSDEDMMQACFDRHYEIAELNKLIPIDKFVSWLKQRREEILTSSIAQTLAYIWPAYEASEEETAWLIRTLVSPDPESLVQVLCYRGIDQELAVAA
jgi:hypothetical protein